jgi:hypothetical protein
MRFLLYAAPDPLVENRCDAGVTFTDAGEQSLGAPL